MIDLKQLELKDIAPYLPYGLKALQLDYKKNGNGSKYGVLVGFYPLYENKKPVWHYTFDNNATGQTAKAIKPLLRPMSDLFKGSKKAIGEIVELNQSYDYNDSFTEVYDSNEDYYLDFSNVKNLPYQVVEILFKYHFDVFGLLEKGLAEPIKNK